MSEPRYFVHPRLADALATGDAVFCDQVGKVDVYIDRHHVVEIMTDWDADMSMDEFGRTYDYKHAKLKFPRIANKMDAMRQMLWGQHNAD